MTVNKKDSLVLLILLVGALFSSKYFFENPKTLYDAMFPEEVDLSRYSYTYYDLGHDMGTLPLVVDGKDSLLLSDLKNIEIMRATNPDGNPNAGVEIYIRPITSHERRFSILKNDIIAVKDGKGYLYYKAKNVELLMHYRRYMDSDYDRAIDSLAYNLLADEYSDSVNFSLYLNMFILFLIETKFKFKEKLRAKFISSLDYHLYSSVLVLLTAFLGVMVFDCTYLNKDLVILTGYNLIYFNYLPRQVDIQIM